MLLILQIEQNVHIYEKKISDISGNADADIRRYLVL